MGTDKKSHIQEILNLPNIKIRWNYIYKRKITSSDINNMYQEFIPLQIECLTNYSELIPGTLETVELLRDRNYKIGSTTGYTREIMEKLIPIVKKQGFKPDTIISSSDVKKSRPYPNMIFKNMMELGTSKVKSCVKVDDTPLGIEEGLNAGCWTIGLSASRNGVGRTFDEWNKYSISDKNKIIKRSTEQLKKSGAHYVVDSINEIIPCIDDIEKKLRSK